MPNWGGLILTNKGKNLQAKVEAGTTLEFTKIKFGDGTISQGQTLETLLDLISPKQTAPISSVQPQDNGLCEIRSIITNTTIEQGYYLKEMGLFATDPDIGEILFAITTDTAPDYFVAGGGSVVISEEFSINLVISNAAHISAVINPQGLVTVGVLNLTISNHNNDPDAHGNLSKGMPIGTIYHAIRTDTPEGGVRLDGGEYTQALLPDVYAMLIDGKLPSCSYAEYTAFLTANNGNCGIFGLDTVNQVFKVPVLKDGVFISAALNGTIGQYFEAGLPNITGEIGQYRNFISTGCFKLETTSAYDVVSGGSVNFEAGKSSFDASRSNSIYGKSSTVLPEHIRYPLFMVLFNKQQTASEAQYGEFIGALEGKANKDFSNVTKPYITEYWASEDNQSWYRKWSDGFIEQGGRISGTTQIFNINLLKPYSSDKYILMVTKLSKDTSTSYIQATKIIETTNTSFKIRLETDIGGFWLAEGY